jgi:hypothetical protein
VVIWKVVLPSGSDVNGTLVGETRPTVCSYVSVGGIIGVVEVWAHTRNGANILDWRTTDAELASPSVCTFWRLVTGPLALFACACDPAMMLTIWSWSEVARVVLPMLVACSAQRQKFCGAEMR